LGFKYYAQNNALNLPADHRLAFREFGLAVGLRALERLEDLVDRHLKHFKNAHQLQSSIHSLYPFRAMGGVIESFWLEPRARESETWKRHQDINSVMLATTLIPDGYLTIV